MTISSHEVHTRTRSVRFGASELRSLLAAHVAELCGDVRITWPGVTYKVDFEDETEGSPSYKTGTKCVVTIIEDLTPQECPEWGVRVPIETPEQKVAQALYNSCVPDHAAYPYTGRCIAERAAFEKQARAAIAGLSVGHRGSRMTALLRTHPLCAECGRTAIYPNDGYPVCGLHRQVNGEHAYGVRPQSIHARNRAVHEWAYGDGAAERLAGTDEATAVDLRAWNGIGRKV